MTEPLRVLIVEDEALILMQLEALVEDAGHAVVGTAMRSEEAIDVARAVRPDLALVDLSLCEGGSGREVVEALEALGNVLTVFVTANPTRLGDDCGGAAGVISKPFSQAVMARGIAYLAECVGRSAPLSPLPNGMTMSSRHPPSRPTSD